MSMKGDFSATERVVSCGSLHPKNSYFNRHLFDILIDNYVYFNIIVFYYYLCTSFYLCNFKYNEYGF